MSHSFYMYFAVLCMAAVSAQHTTDQNREETCESRRSGDDFEDMFAPIDRCDINFIKETHYLQIAQNIQILVELNEQQKEQERQFIQLQELQNNQSLQHQLILERMEAQHTDQLEQQKEQHNNQSQQHDIIIQELILRMNDKNIKTREQLTELQIKYENITLILNAFLLNPKQVEEKAKNDERERRLKASSFLDNPSLFGVIDPPAHAGGSITGLTVLDSQLFVVGGYSTYVNVYYNLTLISRITITRSSRLYAIVSSPRYNCLYISDIGLKVVHRYNLFDNAITQWSVGGECYGLSLTSTHNVLVTLLDINRIQEYTPDGSLIRDTYLDSSIERPWHSVQLSSGLLVVSHGLWGRSLHRVCIVDKIGQIIECYGGYQGSGIGRLNGPTNLAVDRYDNVLVADSCNNRVVLLSPSLTHLLYITIPGQTLSLPYTLHLDPLTRRLYIGEQTNPGRVLVLIV